MYFSSQIPALFLCARFKQYKITTDISVFFFPPQDARFKLFRNGTLRINNVEVYDGQMYSCETRTLAGQLSGLAQVSVLGELRGSLGSSVKHAGFLSSVQIGVRSDKRKRKSDAFYLPGLSVRMRCFMGLRVAVASAVCSADLGSSLQQLSVFVSFHLLCEVHQSHGQCFTVC